MAVDYLLISDDGPGFKTIEGEGRLVGHPSLFLRLFGCNLTCRAWASPSSPFGCDSYISWKQKNKYTFRQLFDHWEENDFVTDLTSGKVILKSTGGEPMLRQEPLFDFLEAFKETYGSRIGRIDIETNSTLMPDIRWIEK